MNEGAVFESDVEMNKGHEEICPFEESKDAVSTQDDVEIEEQIEEEGLVLNFVHRTGDDIRRKLLMRLT